MGFVSFHNDHGLLGGLSDDDHTQYVLRSILTTDGDLFSRNAGAIVRVAAVATGQVFASAGTGTLPEWSASPTLTGLTLSGTTASKPVFTDANKALVSTGTLGVDQGGTGLTTLTANRIPYGAGTSAFASSADLIFDGTSLTVGTAGPHAIGGAVNANNQLTILGSWAKYTILSLTSTVTAPDNAVTPRMFNMQSTLNAYPDGDAFGIFISPTLNKAGSGTHADFAGAYFGTPTIGAGAAALTRATTLLIEGAPSAATSNYALWVDAGTTRLDAAVSIGIATPTVSGSGLLHMSADTFRLDTARTPASAGAAGNAGDICWDASFIYVCTATNTWERVGIASW